MTESPDRAGRAGGHGPASPAARSRWARPTATPRKPRPHEVTVPPFLDDRTPVTNAEYRRFCDATGRPYPESPALAATCPIHSGRLHRSSGRQRRLRTMRPPTRPGSASACRPKRSGSGRHAAARIGGYPWGDDASRWLAGGLRRPVDPGRVARSSARHRIPVHRAGWLVPGKRLRPARHGRQRLGVVRELVLPLSVGGPRRGPHRRGLGPAAGGPWRSLVQPGA